MNDAELDEKIKRVLKGRPEEYNKEEYAQKLLKWAYKPDSTNFCQFCAEEFIPATYITRWKNHSEVFCQAYDIARLMLGAKRESNLNKNDLHVKAYDLNAKVYDPFLNEQFMKEKQIDAELKKENPDEKHFYFYDRDPTKREGDPDSS